MAVHGYITHAAHNRRCTAWLVLGYIVAFEVIGAFALTLPLLAGDHEHTILSNPAGYAIRYALPIALAAGFLFWRMYAGHAKAVTHALGIRIVARQDEPRFVQIAEEQCTALGVRVPRFGVIETDEPNALTVGEGPARGLIAVTRGLLVRLDDDELAAVLAHEASHIRHGDTKLLAANHALMRTALIIRMNNPLRFETWRQMVVPLIFPPMLLIMLAGGAATMLSMRLARAARRSLKLGRDFVADGEAIRVTHYPEALISAIIKIGGRGVFQGSERVEGLLFDGPADHDGGSHPAIKDRLESIASLGRELMNPARLRRDSRAAAASGFGRRLRSVAARYPLDASGRPFERPEQPKHVLWLYLTDREAYRAWENACLAWDEWELSQRRDAIGLAPKVIIPLAGTCLALLVITWPKDGDFSKMLGRFNPTEMVEIARMTNSGPFCMGPSYPDGKCGTGNSKHAPKVAGPAAGSDAATPLRKPGTFVVDQSSRVDDWKPPSVLPVLLLALVIFAVMRPGFLRTILAHLEPKEIAPREPAPDDVAPADNIESTTMLKQPWRRETFSNPPVREFGRRKAT